MPPHKPPAFPMRTNVPCSLTTSKTRRAVDKNQWHVDKRKQNKWHDYLLRQKTTIRRHQSWRDTHRNRSISKTRRGSHTERSQMEHPYRQCSEKIAHPDTLLSTVATHKRSHKGDDKVLSVYHMTSARICLSRMEHITSSLFIWETRIGSKTLYGYYFSRHRIRNSLRQKRSSSPCKIEEWFYAEPF